GSGCGYKREGVDSFGYTCYPASTTIMQLQFVASLAVCATLASALPQNYQATGVLQPEDTAELGSYNKVVAATIDLLPEIAEVFERVSGEPSNDPEKVSQIMLEFMPISRKAWRSAADVEGRTIKEEDLHRFNAAEAVLPSVITFMNRLRNMNFLDTNAQTFQGTNF
ncbi:hypothetical protein OTU49_008923, partial [Cherax quadricarinatus]